MKFPVADDPFGRARQARMKAVKGLGSVQRRGKKSFRLRVANGRDPETGKRRPIEETFVARSDDPAKQEEEALEALAELILDKAAGRSRVDVAFTFGEVLDLWFAQTATELEELTADSYRGYLAHIPDWLRELPIETVTTEHLEDLYRQLRTNGNKRTGKPLAIKYVRGGVHLCINNALQMARRRRWIRHNPAADVEWPNPKKAKRARRRPTPTPVPGTRNILTLASERYGLAMEAFLRVTAAAGGRRGEVHGLRWQYIDFETGVLEFVDTVVRSRAGRERGGPRSKVTGGESNARRSPTLSGSPQPQPDQPGRRTLRSGPTALYTARYWVRAGQRRGATVGARRVSALRSGSFRT